MNDVCNGHSSGSCLKELWPAIPAIVLVALLLVFSLPLTPPRLISKGLTRILAPFRPTLTLSEIKELERRFALENTGAAPCPPPNTTSRVLSRYNLCFAGLSLIEIVMWLVVGVQNAIHALQQTSRIGSISFLCIPFLVSTTWAYALTRVLHRPPVTPPNDLFILFILHLCGRAVALGGHLYNFRTSGTPLPPRWVLVAEGIDLGIVILLLTLVISLPLSVRSDQIDRDAVPEPSPEDYTSLAGWMTFSWIYPLIKVGTKKKLNDEDVWDISPTMKSRYTFFAFKHTPGSSLIWRLIRVNSMDLFIDFALTEVSVLLEFSGPFFLRNILQNLENPYPGSKNQAYLYAVLAFIASLVKIQVDHQHLWYGRRAASRIGTQLSAAIYEKTLRMTDQSGAVGSTSNPKATDPALPKGVGGEDSKKDAGKRTTRADVGKIVNLMGIDCQKVQDLVGAMPEFYGAPLQMGLACWFLYSLLGMSTFAGFIPMFLSVPLSRLLASVVKRNTKGILTSKDERMKLLSEMFGSIKSIKLFGWEDQWIKKIMDVRKREMYWLKKGRNANVWYSFLWMLVPNVISITSFFVFVASGHDLSVSVVFSSVRMFDLLRMPLASLPVAIITFTEATISVERLTAFFNEGEVPKEICSFVRPTTTEPEELSVENGTFRWTTGGLTGLDASATINSTPAPPSSSDSGINEDDATASASTSVRTAVDQDRNQAFTLRDINVRIPRGRLTVVTGPTASGKTALLMALLGEMDRISGSTHVPKNPTIVDEYGLRNSISFAAQTPWLQQQSIKENIIFEYPFDPERYAAVVDACALLPDFKALGDGDLTQIGSKGVSLSGGQKARVVLARAVYAPTQYLILDDIFSAVDSHTARILFDNLLKGPLITHRAVLLVTHHVELVLPETHRLIIMSEGRIERQGAAKELKGRGLLDYVSHDLAHVQRKETVQEKEGDQKTQQGITHGGGTLKVARKLVEEEVRAEGKVKWSTYRKYMKASSYWTWGFVVTCIIIRQMGDVGTRVWMGIWGSAYLSSASLFIAAFGGRTSHLQSLTEQRPVQHLLQNMTVAGNFYADRIPEAHLHPLFYVSIYSVIGVLTSLVGIASLWVVLTGGLHGGFVLFKDMLISLSGANFRYFDTTPTGRILNRFGKDIDMIDGMLPFITRHMATNLASFLGAVITVAVVVPWFIPVGALLTYCYVRLSMNYLATGRDLRRLESTSRSPILAGFSDLVSGIVTVRAFSAERQFLNRHYGRVDTNQRFWYFTWMLNRWLLLNFDLLGAVSVLCSTIFVLAGSVPAGYAALAVVSATSISTSVYWTCKGVTELELCLNSVERVVEVLNIPQEPLRILENRRVPAYWPSSSGSDSLLVVENLEVKYAPDLPSVLHGISFSLKGRQRVGLLGRTGCGKSTLATSLLRFVEPTNGRIIIDGIDIASIGTHDLRSRLTYIPQDAALFTGTVRDNLDPFNEHSDAECLDALARVHLNSPSSSQKWSSWTSQSPSLHGDQEETMLSSGSETATMPGDPDNQVIIALDTSVSTGGQNFSHGQRQLLAIARALLRQSGVVILDEATSSIDKAADIKIQAAIRKEFNHSLLLTTAHRLDAIIDFDCLIVLDKGRIAEFDTPFNLIRREGGVFREMCIQSGTYNELEAAARAHAQV